MEGTAVRDLQAEQALARSVVYRFLSTAFLPPGAGLEPPVGGEETTAALLQAAHLLGCDEVVAAAERMRTHLEKAGSAALREEYHTLFGHQIAQDCPLYETQHAAGHVFQQAQQLADIGGFYLAFGVEVSDAVRERVDHLSLELEFMHVLTFREAYARLHHGSNEVALLRDAQRAFLGDHLSRWVPTFARLVGRKGEGLYRLLADLVAACIAFEAASFGLSPGEEVELAPSVSLDPDESLLPCGAERCPLEPLP